MSLVGDIAVPHKLPRSKRINTSLFKLANQCGGQLRLEDQDLRCVEGFVLLGLVI